jgi:hypothetical protein
MAGVYENSADPLLHRAADKGYTIGWKLKYGFERGRLDENLTYGDAKKKAAEMEKKEPEKAFWPEMIMTPKFHM